jgi:hypothetical protein
MGMARGVAGEMADRGCILHYDLSNQGEPSRQMDDKYQQGIAASPEPPDLVYCTNGRKEDDHILLGNSGGAGLPRRRVKTKEGIFMRCAVPVCASLGVKSLAVIRQSCAANKRSGRGERTDI